MPFELDARFVFYNSMCMCVVNFMFFTFFQWDGEYGHLVEIKSITISI